MNFARQPFFEPVDVVSGGGLKANSNGAGLLITVRDRLIAGTGSLGAITLATGAKAALIVLVIWTLALTLGQKHLRSGLSNAFANIARPAPPILMLCVLAGYAALSAVWARDAVAAFGAGAVLAAILLCSEWLGTALKSVRDDLAVLIAGWFVIGLVIGLALLISEILTDFSLYRWLLVVTPGLNPEHGSMVAEQKGEWILLNRSLANWSVAGINLLLWPALLVVTSIVRGRAKFWAVALIMTLVAIVTSVSDHQTSQLAILVSTAIFAAAFWAPQSVRRVMLASFLIFIVSVVPLSYAAGHQLQLQNASWAQMSLKDRFRIWGNAAAHAAQSPVLGIGARNTTTIETDTDPAQPAPDAAFNVQAHHPHNAILQIWLELGALGAAFLSAAIILLFREISKMSPARMPYVLAATAVTFIEAIATWNLWGAWYLSVLAISLNVMVLGLRVSDIALKRDALSFAAIWLPAQWSRKNRGIT